MDNNKKAARLDTGTASNPAINKPYSTKADPLQGWYSLGAGVKSSRLERTAKKSWKRNNTGRIDPLLAMHLGMLALAALVIGGGKYA